MSPRSVESNSIVARGLVVEYPSRTGPLRALDCPDFEIAAGSSVAVMGPSGCGKSTLLGLLAGLAVPTEGTLRVGQEMVSAMPERQRVRFRRRALGMIYQADNLLPHLTVEENVGLQWAICRRDTDGDRRADPGAVLDRLGIGDLAGRLPDQLSGGQRQRAAVARAIVHRPSVLLADEPTGSLDAANAAAVIGLLVELQREILATLVMVTHDPMTAAHLDRTVRLSRPATTAESDDAR